MTVPTDIRLTPTSTVLGWFRDATSKDCSPSLADVQQFVERLHATSGPDAATGQAIR